MSEKLHFNAYNFQAYVREKEGTNFILLHFVSEFFVRSGIASLYPNTRQWFHTLIVLLHQPTLLTSFGGSIQQLYPNSRELSMSSAKTIADILSFAELVDCKSFIGNPFTSQPIYVAACAFIMESIYYSSSSTGGSSTPQQASLGNETSGGAVLPNGQDRKTTTKHALLGSAAKENYQRCYKALKALATSWEGGKYILTVLDQKTEGIVDPLLYTTEEMESTLEVPSIHPISTPNWQDSGKSAAEASSSDPHKFDFSQGKDHK